jgi:DNA-binding CsgD family transcriptional regulator
VSFIGLNGHPSFINASPKNLYKEPATLLISREREILMLIADGKGSKEIACQLNLSQETIKTHRRNILAKMDVQNTAELIRVGWI